MMSRVQNLKSALNETYNSNLSSHDKIVYHQLGDGQAMCFGSNRVVTKTQTHQSLERKTYQKVYHPADSKDTMGRNQVGSSMSSKHAGGATRQNGTNINLDLS
mmetsp:Transcript_12796/g.19811  ORF Transcript_12796/g.19811 Transcript_12796/m.19811 type:complete len:103 (+) Transcript_12796:23-331(+)